MSTNKYASADKLFTQLIDYWQVKGYKGLSDYINVQYQTLMAWKKRDSIGDYAPFMDKGISKHWLETGEGPMLTTAAYPHGTDKFKAYAQAVSDTAAKDTQISVSADELVLLGYYRQGDPKQRQQISESARLTIERLFSS